jgi:type IV secretory pathway VirB10-like protein
VKKLRRSLHHISAQNDILHHEIKGLKEALLFKKRHKKKSYTLQLQEDDQYHGGALFLSPRKIEAARLRESEKKRQEDELQLQKAETKELKKAAQLYKQKIAEEKRVEREREREGEREGERERERLKEVREKERAEKAAEKERQKAARDAEKAIQLSQKGNSKASQSSTQKQKRQKRVVVDASCVQPEVAAPAAPLVTTRRGRNVKLPSKYK